MGALKSFESPHYAPVFEKTWSATQKT